MFSLIDDQGNILYYNPATADILGYPLHEHNGRPILSFVHPDDLPVATQFIRSLRIAPDAPETVIIRVRHLDGHYRWLEVTGTNLLHDPEIGAILLNSRDITERRRIEDAEREQHRFAEAMYDSLAALTSSRDVDQVLQQILAYAGKVVPSDGGSILLIEGGSIRVAHLRGFSPEAEAFFREQRFELEESIHAELFLNKQPYMVADTAEIDGWKSLPGSDWIRCSMGIPIEVRGSVAGALVADSALPNFFQSGDVEKLQAFARYAGLALENALYFTLLEQKVEERTAELTAAKERVEAILNNSIDAIVLTHGNLSIQQTNTAFDALFGSSAGEYSGKSLLDCIHQEDIERAHQTVQSVLVNRAGRRFEARARRNDGSLFEAELSIGCVSANSSLSEGLVCTIRDISQRKARERQLRYHASLQQNVSDAIISTDLDFRIQSWNPAAEAIYGWRAEDAIGRTVMEVLPTLFASNEDRERLTRALFSGHAEGEFVQRRRDGTRIHVSATLDLMKDDSGRPAGIVSVVHDITQRKQAEEAIREGEARYRLLAENVTDVVVRLSADGKYLFVSPSSAGMIGYTPEEMLGQHRFSYIHPDGLPMIKQLHQSAIENPGPMPIVSYRFRHKDGHYVWVESACRAVVSETTGQVEEFVYTSRDITERRHAELELQRRETWYRALAANIPGTCTLLFDRDLRYLVAAGAPPVFAQAAKEHRSARELLPEIGLADWIPRYEATLRGECLRFEDESDGRIFDVQLVPVREDSGEILTGLIVARDITAEREAERTIRENEERLRILFDNLPDAITLLTLDGVYVDANPAALRMSQYSSDEIIGKNVFDTPLFSPEDYERAREGLEKTRWGLRNRVEFTLNRADGTNFTVEVLTHPVNIQGKRLHLSISRDITARKKVEAMLRKTLQAEKELGELKSRFVSIASHEFRTPLASIMSSSEILKMYRHKLDDARIDEKLSTIVEQVKYLTAIINDVLDLSRLQSQRIEFKPEEVALDLLCREIISDYQSQPEITHELLFTSGECPALAHVDKSLMRQVITNLISNAVKYSPPTEPITLQLEREDGCVMLSVQDRGIGIPEADLKHLFEPFHRAANAGSIPGTGLGLSIVKEAVELYGGSITVESVAGVGSTFRVRIPCAVHDQPSR